LNHWDWIVIFAYLTGVVAIAICVTRGQRNLQDYYLAGKRVRWWESGVSTMATQLGAVSFISAPAFVALQEDGGLKWLSYEFGVPLALILVMHVIIPTFHRGNYISIYEYLEQRFDSGTRTLVSLLFQIGRGLATAISLLAGGLIVSTALSIPTSTAILLLGVVTIIYDTLGGIRVVVISDVLQMGIIATGLAVCGSAAWWAVGWEGAWASLDPIRYEIIDLGHFGVSPEGQYGFWPMVIGGVFLYASYYGCDQSQVQRELTVRDVDDIRKSLLLNAVGRFPLVLAYCLMGVFVGAVFSRPESLAPVADTFGVTESSILRTLRADPDRMVPMFILSYLPNGVIGLIFAAIMAALMSSLDSALNSLSAVSIKDFYQKYFRPSLSDQHYLRASRYCTLFWGLFCVGFSLLFLYSSEGARQTTIVLINAMGSLLYGPILAAFLLGMLTERVSAFAIKGGIVAGILINMFIWLLTGVSWLWWNFTGCATTAVVAWGLSWGKVPADPGPTKPEEPSRYNWPLAYLLLVGYFLLIIVVSYLIEGAS
jgi:solute carrier family 5 (sodium-dependent multivitamin transporter), member 6